MLPMARRMGNTLINADGKKEMNDKQILLASCCAHIKSKICFGQLNKVVPEI